MAAIQNVLHPTDLSDAAEPALGLAQRLAQDLGARLIVLHVVDRPVLYGEMGMTIPIPEAQSALIEQRHRELESKVAGSSAECRVVEGLAAGEILRIARELPADLIVMGTHGRGGIARVLMGSVVENVLRHAPCPVLAIKKPHLQEHPKANLAVESKSAEHRPLFPVILHPSDFSPRAHVAFDVACRLARGGGRLIVLHVVEEVHVASEGYEDALNERLHELKCDDPTIEVEYRLCEGDSAEMILREAGESSCDLIALGTHGRTGLERLIMGSVAEAVLRRARCAVLAVRASAGATPMGNTGIGSNVVF